MNMRLRSSIENQRQALREYLASALYQLARDCNDLWPDRQALEHRLMAGLHDCTYCKYMYLLDDQARQITSNASRNGLLAAHFDRDRSGRPYMAAALSGEEFSLSESYISRNSKRPSITAVKRVVDSNGRLRGYLAADFDLRELPMTQASYEQPEQWMQLKGDPAIRSGLFYQERVYNPLDEHIDVVMPLLEELITMHGIFHMKLHFSRSRATIWAVDHPFRFCIHGIDELADPNLCMAYSHHRYPEDAAIPAAKVPEILQVMRQLRYMDETIYLRSGLVNIFNGVIGLTFSCDGSHYMPWDEFLDKDISFWLGNSSSPTACVHSGQYEHLAQASAGGPSSMEGL